MKIEFRINYHTQWGERIYITGNIPELGMGDLTKAVAMNYNAPDNWSLEIEVADIAKTDLEYKYIFKNENSGKIEEEWGAPRPLTIKKSVDKIMYIDAWNSVSDPSNNFLTAPFVNVLLKSNYTPETGNGDIHFSHSFKVKAPLLKKGEAVCIIGNCEELGNWDINTPRLLNNKNFPEWSININLSKAGEEIHYKYGIYDTKEKQFRYFEEGPDRIVPNKSGKMQVNITDTFIRTNNTGWRGAGVSIPVFSLRSNRSFGCGDFTDLKLMADWASSAGLKLIQVLPLNDTISTHTGSDVLPYAAISAFALNPLFMDLDKLPIDPKSDIATEYKKLQPELNSLEIMDYERVIAFKLKYIQQSYLYKKSTFLKDKKFKEFYKENEYWLKPYSVYSCIRDHKGSADYRTWKEFAKYSEKKANELSSPKHPWYDDVAQWWYCQYHLHLQLLESVEYAHSKGIVMKGDIPIGVNRNSVDTWVEPELFNMNMAAGAPPDMFAIKGQNWELPTYNWEAIERTDYTWWKKRFAQMSRYFDTFRIDHILGFFRIWQIPLTEVEGIMGYLNPSVPLYVDEFEKRGIWFDYERFTKPYITDEILNQLFGEESNWVRQHCLYIEHGFAYRLRPEYQHQAEVEARYNKGEFSEKVKYGLFDLISNVLLFEVPGSEGRQYYPRFGMQTLSTYAALDWKQKQVFDELYVDYFYRRQDSGWYESGLKKLQALKNASNMLICGEDLGMMTHCVTEVMKRLSILSLEIQRAPKTDKIEFFHPADAPYLSVVTPSTHDMSTIRGWWEEDHAVSQRFYNQQLGHWGGAPYFAEWWICRDILNMHLYSPAMWSIFQWQDLMSISPELRRENPNDERINVPSNTKYSWRYRMHITLEDLLSHTEFTTTLKNYITQSGR